MNRKMTRLAFGGEVRRPRRQRIGRSAAASAALRLPRPTATPAPCEPRPTPQWPKKCRRVRPESCSTRRRRWSARPSHASFPRNEFVEVQQHPRQRRVQAAASAGAIARRAVRAARRQRLRLPAAANRCVAGCADSRPGCASSLGRRLARQAQAKRHARSAPSSSRRRLRAARCAAKPWAISIERLVVGQRQGLQRRVRARRGACRPRRASGASNVLQERIRARSPEIRVHAAAIAVGALALAPELHLLREAIDSLGLRRIDARPADLGESAVRWRPAPRRESLRPRAATAAAGRAACCTDRPRPGRRACVRRLPIGGAGDDQPVQRLQAPAAVDELAGQPVEQLGMRRPVALRAEIVLRLDQAAGRSTPARCD